jgi:hypothetical protein
MSTSIASSGSGAEFKREVMNDHKAWKQLRLESSRRQYPVEVHQRPAERHSALQLPSRNQQCSPLCTVQRLSEIDGL